MDLDGDGFLDLVTINDGEIVGGNGFSRREHVFVNDGKGRFRDMTDAWWPPASNVGEDDNMVAFLDYDSDGDADFVVGSLSGPDRLLMNDGRGHLSLRRDVFGGEDTPGTLGLALADLDGDGRMDVVQGQGEHKTAIDERVFSGRGLAVDTAPPSVTHGRRARSRRGPASGARAGARSQEPEPAVRVASRGGRVDGRLREARGADAMVRRGTCGARTGRRTCRRQRLIACVRPTRREYDLRGGTQ